MLLPDKAATPLRKQAASLLVRYMGGDVSLVEEVAANRLVQEELPHEYPARPFGQILGSEAMKRKKEELEICEVEGGIKRARAQSALDVSKIKLESLKHLELPVSDRDRITAKDIIRTAGFAEAPNRRQVQD
jgi:hypothetical protein